MNVARSGLRKARPQRTLWLQYTLPSVALSCREAPIRAREAVVRFKAQLADAKANILNQARDVEVRDFASGRLARL